VYAGVRVYLEKSGIIQQYESPAEHISLYDREFTPIFQNELGREFSVVFHISAVDVHGRDSERAIVQN
jgi:hypothetical protein